MFCASALPAQAIETTAQGVTLAGGASKKKLRFGAKLRLEGRVAPAAAGRAVRLEHAPRGQAWRAVARAKTGSRGAYRFDVRARRTGAYRAVSEGTTSSLRRVVVSARVGGKAMRHVLVGRSLRLRGVLKPAVARRKVRMQLYTGGRWRTVDVTRTGRGGRFRAAWKATRRGTFRVRLAFGGDRQNAATTRKLPGRVNVYRRSFASWYGPGLYGNGLACGGRLGYGTLGVAHKSLPCGTRLTIRNRGRSVTVRVVDRGPFVAGREFDLTAATKRAIGFGSTGSIWVTR
ncbi:MAG TPA: septal ring lytic transglycosylase RlpA family protein [Thermoleophilaceae bacterium]|nr:septal ring lytic transglycosylase RlpA family protein [Thermoleophilaceae bacterium]